MATSVFQQVIAAVVAGIQALDLTDILDANVIDLDHNSKIEEQLPSLPGIIVLPITDNIADGGGTNAKDDVEYVVGIGIFSENVGPTTSAANKDRHMLWRQRIRDAFVNKRLTGLTYTCKYRGGAPLYDAQYRRLRQMASQTMILRFYSREARS
jgi:hypothetical protein